MAPPKPEETTTTEEPLLKTLEKIADELRQNKEKCAQELIDERSQIIQTVQRLAREGRYVDSITWDQVIGQPPYTASIGASLSSMVRPENPQQPEPTKTAWKKPTSSNPASAGSAQAFNVKRVGGAAVKGALFALAVQLAISLPSVIAAEPSDRPKAWKDLVVNLVKSGSLAGFGAGLAETIFQLLSKFESKILGLLGATTCSVVATAAKTAGFATLAVAAIHGLRALWHGIWAKLADMGGDSEGKKENMDKLHETLSLDTLCRIAAAALGTFAASAATGVLTACGIAYASGPVVAIVIGGIMLWLTSAFTEELIQKKTESGGWIALVRGLLQSDSREKMWVGPIFDELDNDELIPDELRCGIKFTVPVDPVRSLRTGQMYERRALYRWVDQTGRDPITRLRVTRLDYVDSPVAAMWGERIASLTHAKASVNETMYTLTIPEA